MYSRSASLDRFLILQYDNCKSKPSGKIRYPNLVHKFAPAFEEALYLSMLARLFEDIRYYPIKSATLIWPTT